ncbi:hypothetical protein [Pseudorhodoplanes sp.]|uniref:hypothetical protein n=1 Tax=Pseudorhodoplanes sp. TaxID=1934341 RepID=UPI002CD10B78|nr:hypothetical protein [Pseudorhodoplanes sp.]HWV54977.1 hypothetical protein [Pseudorhodoplanes sp.]
MPNRRMNACPVPVRAAGVCVVALAAVLLSGCSTTDIDKIPHEIGGLPAGAPARPAQAADFPAVHAMPPPRAAPLDPDQQKRLEADLVAARERQARQQKEALRAAGATEAQAKAKPKSKPKSEANGQTRARAKDQTKSQDKSSAGSRVPGQAAPGTPPWPMPSQTTGGSPRP